MVYALAFLTMAYGDEFRLEQVNPLAWADFAKRTGLQRAHLAREMKRMANAAQAPASAQAEMPEYEAATRRQTALAPADRAFGTLSALGVKARLIGSLPDDPSKFRNDSDIDILVEDRNGFDEIVLFLETEKQIDGIALDLVFLESVPEEMRKFL